MDGTARGTFEIDLVPATAELGAGTGRFDFDKTFHGDLSATSKGVMLSAGDPASGTAGYVALEVVTGILAGREGGFVFQQFGRMASGDQELRYEIVPGSGTGGLAGVSGALQVQIDDGEHNYVLTYSLPAVRPDSGVVAGRSES